MNKLRALVTGANGHLGSQLIRTLMERGYWVRGTTRKRPFVSCVADELVYADLLDPESLTNAAHGIDVVFHTAAPNPVKPMREKDVIDAIFVGTTNVFEAAKRCGVKTFVYTSSCGAVGMRVEKNSNHLSEADWNPKPLYPSNQGKLKAERWLVEQSLRNDIRIERLCPPLMIGPGALQSNAAMDLFIKLKKGKRVFLPYMGFSVTDVRDAAMAHVLALEKGKGGRWIIAGEYIETPELIKKIKNFGTMFKISSRLIPPWVIYGLTAIHPRLKVSAIKEVVTIRQRVSSTKAKEELGWCPRSLDETLRATLFDEV